jgi:hypothetical protein
MRFFYSLAAMVAFTSLLTTCSKDKTQASSTIETKIDSASASVEQSGSIQAGDSCVFNNDLRTLTMDWVKEVRALGFVWHSQSSSAIKVFGSDTVTLRKGGCDHFGITAEMSIIDSHDVEDSLYWITKALKLAEEYQMKDYVDFIKNGRLYRDRTSEIYVWYNVVDTTQITNTYYDGIVIADIGARKRLTLNSFSN